MLAYDKLYRGGKEVQILWLKIADLERILELG